MRRWWRAIPVQVKYTALGILIGQILGTVGTVYTLLAACSYLKR